MEKNEIKKLIRLDAERSKAERMADIKKYISAIKEISKIVKIAQGKC